MLATAGDLVFTGNPEGDSSLWSAHRKQAVELSDRRGNRGSAISYSVGGRQYIATPTGWQQAITGAQLAPLFPDQNWRAGSTLIVFALPEVK